MNSIKYDAPATATELVNGNVSDKLSHVNTTLNNAESTLRRILVALRGNRPEPSFGKEEGEPCINAQISVSMTYAQSIDSMTQEAEMLLGVR